MDDYVAAIAAAVAAYRRRKQRTKNNNQSRSLLDEEDAIVSRERIGIAFTLLQRAHRTNLRQPALKSSVHDFLFGCGWGTPN